ncbi:MAG: NYN domain-containing protein, partial [Egibacteraceae bacterium]
MDRCAILIDAGHLLAEGGKLCCGTKKRLVIRCDYSCLIAMLVDYAQGHCQLPVLRTYWYDGARDGIPTADHLHIARLAGVKLRLGRLSGGKQKGVDALIYRDLMTLARERAIATAYLLGGDEDLREGVAAAQDMGVRVVVLGIDTKETGERANQADTLVREADERHVFQRDQLAPFFFRLSASP